ncbi:MAG: hypothetical protein DWC09_06655 [Candidatus Poseidoniales archaeon]|nr:MAG: hypothetical protein DWC09_06655 [Candidatus Poseidoniales archaeon]
MKPNLDKKPIVLRQVEFLANNITRVGSVSSDPLQALRILIWLLRVIGQTLRIHPIEYTDTMYQLD